MKNAEAGGQTQRVEMTPNSLLDPAQTSERRTHAAARGRRLEHLTIGWNAIEALIAIGAGVSAGSIVLVGFGADSVIECFSGGVLLWRLHATEADGGRERLALKWVGLSFLLLAVYIVFDAGKTLWQREPPETSIVGIAVGVVSVVVMPLLARAKHKVAAQLESGALAADSTQTNLCAYLSAIMLAGLAVNALWGWWWADPAAALLMVPIIGREGMEALRGEPCSDCH